MTKPPWSPKAEMGPAAFESPFAYFSGDWEK
jgi:hypothetical protein